MRWLVKIFVFFCRVGAGCVAGIDVPRARVSLWTVVVVWDSTLDFVFSVSC